MCASVRFAGLKLTGESAVVETLLAPVSPPDIYCIGLNYMKHFEEVTQ